MTVPSIHTARLDLISMSPAFIDALLAGRRDEAESEAGLILPDAWPDEDDVAFLRLRLDQMGKDPASQEWLARAMVLRTTGRRMVGYAGFHGPPEQIGRAELGYSVMPEVQRRGYATEAAEALMDWARRQHGVDRFFVSIGPDNAPSLAMAAKMGFTKIGEQIDEVDGLEYVFELVRARD